MFEEGYGRVILTASDATQYAWEGNQIMGDMADKSVFTHFLVQALKTGEADSDGDGYITVSDVFSYASKEMRNSTSKQTPNKWAERIQGELVIARNPRPKPVELPSHLHRAIESDFVDVRLKAVEELYDLLHGSNVGLATTALQVLEKLVDDDSRRVSTAAMTYLRGVQDEKLKIVSSRSNLASTLKNAEDRIAAAQRELKSAHQRIERLEKSLEEKEKLISRLKQESEISKKESRNISSIFDDGVNLTQIPVAKSPTTENSQYSKGGHVTIDGELYDMNNVDIAGFRVAINNLDTQKFKLLIDEISDPSVLRRISNFIDLKHRREFLDYIENRIYFILRDKQ
jgi:hypothetical protein